MTINLLQTPEYKELASEHIYKTIDYLFNKNQEFAIACVIKHLKFNPELPHEIKDSFQDIALFILSGYTFETASLDQKTFTFEAGFGENNFGSTITVPLLAIKQLMLEDTPIILNLSEYTKPKAATEKNSMESLLKNPKNKKLLQKRK